MDTHRPRAAISRSHGDRAESRERVTDRVEKLIVYFISSFISDFGFLAVPGHTFGRAWTSRSWVGLGFKIHARAGLKSGLVTRVWQWASLLCFASPEKKNTKSCLCLTASSSAIIWTCRPCLLCTTWSLYTTPDKGVHRWSSRGKRQRSTEQQLHWQRSELSYVYKYGRRGKRLRSWQQLRKIKILHMRRSSCIFSHGKNIISLYNEIPTDCDQFPINIKLRFS
jgi:hypothetical protein